jgi:hypothetical protein
LLLVVAFSVANSWQNFPARPAAVPMKNFYFFDGIGDKEENYLYLCEWEKYNISLIDLGLGE